jgi:hypothetical protein
MKSSQAEFWQAGVRIGKGALCPKLVWGYLRFANNQHEPWEVARGKWIRKRLRIIARTPTPFPLKNPDLNGALKELDLEWLRPSHISRIRECAAPRRKFPRNRFDRQFALYSGVDPASPEKSPKCKQLFWARRDDQKTCEEHWWAASMLRVEKHRKANKDRERNVLQLKDARHKLSRLRRKKRREDKLSKDALELSVTRSNELAILRLLQRTSLGFVKASLESDSELLEAVLREGYVAIDPNEPQTYKLTGQGLQLFGKLKRERQTQWPR